MPVSALEGASKYLNNLLLTRGFLQDGKAIDFAQLAATNNTEEAENADRERYTTTTRLINLVHDLVLRRDRDAEQREALAATIQTLRAEESQRLLDFQRLQDKNCQLEAALSAAEAQQRVLSNATKKAQAEAKELKEQTLKIKSTLDQVRAKCISDVRKRDIELDKLKHHLSNLNRGKKESSAGGMKINALNMHQKSQTNQGRAKDNTTTGEWSLENETNDFLAAVVNETSSENVALRKIVADSMKFLRTLTGLDEQHGPAHNSMTDPSNAIGIPGQYRERDAPDFTQPASLIPVQSLASSMSEVLAHCQSLLRDPSFVPIEEVEIRDQEIDKLRAGWEKMADRWKEALTMMSQWRQKMLNDQDQTHLSTEEAQHHFDAEGLSGLTAFGRSVAMRPNGQPVLDPIEEEELTSMLMDHFSRVGNQSSISHTNAENAKHNSIMHDETLPEPDETGTPRQQSVRIHQDDAEAESDLSLSIKEPVRTMSSPARRGVKIQKPHRARPEERQPLSTTNANPKKRKSATTSSSPRKRRSVSPDRLPTSIKSNLKQPHQAETQPDITATSHSASSDSTTDPLHLDTLTSTDVSDAEVEDQDDIFGSENLTSRNTTSRVPRMTVAQKLAVVEAEATEATEVIRRRQALTRSDERRKSVKRSSAVSKERDTRRKPAVVPGKAATSGKQAGNAKDRVKKARDRRRSTLTPAELETLMGK